MFNWNERAPEAFENFKRELCEAPALGVPTEKGIYVLDTNASVAGITGVLHPEKDWNRKKVAAHCIWQ